VRKVRFVRGQRQGDIRVVVIDDQQLLLDALVRVLSSEPDIEVVGVASSVADALEAIPRLAPAVAVIDDSLADGDGIDAARRLLRQLPDLRVLVLADVDGRVLARSIDAGCTGFLTKDRAMGELLAAVRALAVGDAYVPADLLASVVSGGGLAGARTGQDLTARELETLRAAAGGLTNKAIAEQLGLSVNTVRNHMQGAITKLGAHSKLEAVTVALRTRLIELPDT